MIFNTTFISAPPNQGVAWLVISMILHPTTSLNPCNPNISQCYTHPIKSQTIMIQDYPIQYMSSSKCRIFCCFFLLAMGSSGNALPASAQRNKRCRSRTLRGPRKGPFCRLLGRSSSTSSGKATTIWGCWESLGIPLKWSKMVMLGIGGWTFISVTLFWG